MCRMAFMGVALGHPVRVGAVITPILQLRSSSRVPQASLLPVGLVQGVALPHLSRPRQSSGGNVAGGVCPEGRAMQLRCSPRP